MTSDFNLAYLYCEGDVEFDADVAIIQMIDEGTVFVGGPKTPFFVPNGPAPATLWINCNDLWVWASADAEPLDYADIEPYYIACCDPRPFAITKWICKRFRRLPMAEIVHDMKKQGVWDEEMEELARGVEGNG